MTPQDVWLPVVLVVGVVAVGFFATLSIRARVARRIRERPSARELIEQHKASRDRPGDVRALSAEFVETARRLSAQLDNKTHQLESLLREADDRIATLRGAVEPPAAEPPPAKAPAAKPQRVVDRITQAVYEQADSGLSVVEIARQLDEQVGKVELILALRRV